MSKVIPAWARDDLAARAVPRRSKARGMLMDRLTIILNDPPYGTEKIYNGLHYASALVSAGVKLNLFLLANGVAAVRRSQKTPTGYYNVADMLSELIAKGVKVKT
jgi:sulfur relay (sulfurtransferase) complex TusBCD TusD component (DsrE family)